MAISNFIADSSTCIAHCTRNIYSPYSKNRSPRLIHTLRSTLMESCLGSSLDLASEKESHRKFNSEFLNMYRMWYRKHIQPTFGKSNTTKHTHTHTHTHILVLYWNPISGHLSVLHVWRRAISNCIINSWLYSAWFLIFSRPFQKHRNKSVARELTRNSF